jgi:YHS domain-containing protein
MKQLMQLCLVLITLSMGAQNNLKNGIAIQGYDPVAYFEDGKAIAGNKEISATFDNATYFFSKEAHKVLFLQNPYKFVPQYGGYCAYGLSKGYKCFYNSK